MLQERRVRRSEDPVVALHYRLAAERSARPLQALVLSDGDGAVVAAAGPFAACEHIATFAALARDCTTGASQHPLCAGLAVLEINDHLLLSATNLDKRTPRASSSRRTLGDSAAGERRWDDLQHAGAAVRRILRGASSVSG